MDSCPYFTGSTFDKSTVSSSGTVPPGTPFFCRRNAMMLMESFGETDPGDVIGVSVCTVDHPTLIGQVVDPVWIPLPVKPASGKGSSNRRTPMIMVMLRSELIPASSTRLKPIHMGSTRKLSEA